jgi:maleylpyruvate isomerase
MDVREVLAEIDAASERLAATVARLGDDDLREPSRLPGWTRGHVLAHLTRNADAVWNMLEWARTGVEFPQYPSVEARNAAIEASSRRPVHELRAELRIAVERFALQASTLPEAAWEMSVQARGGWGHPTWYTLYRRWREVEVHHADLDFGYSSADWSPAYVRWELSEILASLRLDGGLAVGGLRATDLGIDERLGDGPQISATGHELLGWLTGRGGTLTGDALPAPPTWPLAPAAWRDATGP